MTPLSSRTLRYARAWLGRPGDLGEDEMILDRDGVQVPATLVRPRRTMERVPAWVVMHGVTRPGRAHQQLVRFTRAVASAGLAAIVPEVPEWRALRLAPDLSRPTVAAAIAGLRDTGIVRDEPVGVIGFSFGAPHAIAVGGDPILSDLVGGVCGFGGYCGLESTFRFMMTGRHEWRGERYVHRPDPYGRWIVGANYLTAVPEYQDAVDVADALRALATHVGDLGAPSWDPANDAAILEVRAEVHESRRDLFDAFAPTSEASPAAHEDAAGLAEDLAHAARQLHPQLDPTPALAEVHVPTHLLHGRMDHLIPFTETFRLNEALTSVQARLTITRIFGHSAQDRFPLARALSEIPRFLKALDGLMRAV